MLPLLSTLVFAASSSGFIEAPPAPVEERATDVPFRVYAAYADLGAGAAAELRTQDAWLLYQASIDEAAAGGALDPAAVLGFFLSTARRNTDEAIEVYLDVERRAALLGDGDAFEERQVQADALVEEIRADRRWRETICQVDRQRCPQESQVEGAISREVEAIRRRIDSRSAGLTAWDVERLARLLRVRAQLRKMELEDAAREILERVVRSRVDALLMRTVR